LLGSNEVGLLVVVDYSSNLSSRYSLVHEDVVVGVLLFGSMNSGSVFDDLSFWGSELFCFVVFFIFILPLLHIVDLLILTSEIILGFFLIDFVLFIRHFACGVTEASF